MTLQRILNGLEQKACWTFADQLLVSGMNFLTGVLLVRGMGVRLYGEFVLLYGVLLYFYSIQMGALLLPMMSMAPQLDPDERRRLLNGTAGLQLAIGVLSFALIVVGAAFARTLHLWNFHAELALGLCTFSFLMQDCLRRQLFVEGRAGAALSSDLISYVGQALAIILLARARYLDVSAALLAVGLTSLLAVFASWRWTRVQLSLQDLSWAYLRLRRQGKHLLVSGQFHWLGSQGALMVAASALGASAAGGLRAAQNIAGPINVAFQAMENVVPIRAAEEFRHAKEAGLLTYLSRVAVVGVVLLGSATVLLAFFAGPLMALLYGPAQREYAPIVVLQLVYYLVYLFWTEATFFHRVVDSTRWIVIATAATSVTSVAVSALLVRHFREIGVMAGLITGISVSLALLLWSGYRVLRHNVSTSGVVHPRRVPSPDLAEDSLAN